MTYAQFKLDWQTVMLHLGYLNVFFQKAWLQGIYWTLAIEFQYYLLIGLLYPLLTHPNQYRRIIAFVSLIGLSVWAQNRTLESFIFVHLPFFLLGFGCFLHKTGKLPIYLFISYGLIMLPTTYLLHHTASTFFGYVAVLIIFFNVDIKLKVGYFLGRVSYSLYLFHMLIGIEILRYGFIYLLPTVSEITKLFFCAGSISVCIGFAYVMYQWIERPALQWSKKVRY